MKKILILTPFGKTGEPEETKLLHIYLSSLKKNVVPYYDVKVILLNNFKVESCESCLTTQKIKDYGLENVVTVKTIYEMDLSERAIQFLVDLGPYVSVGAKLNLLFDYAKRNNFFDAEWLFHVDSDIEFMDNFQKFLDYYSLFPEQNKIIMLSGDVHQTEIGTDEVNYKIDQSDRVYIYDDNSIPEHAYDATKRKVTRHEVHDNTQGCGIRISPQKTKVRNDFVGFDRAFMTWHTNNRKDINWLIEYYPLHCTGLDNHYSKNNKTAEDFELEALLSNKGFYFSFVEDKGGRFEYELKAGTEFRCFRLELPPAGYMVRHYGGGWNPEDSWGGNNFVEKTREMLPKEYNEYKDVWGKDWPDIL